MCMRLTLPNGTKTFDALNDLLKNELFGVDLYEMDINVLKQMLSVINIQFTLEGINRIQSTLICEMKDSYVQQSQRYVALDSSDDVPYYIEHLGRRFGGTHEEREKHNTVLMNHMIPYVEECIDLYNRMTKLKEESKSKGRPKIEDFEYGIPYEDARYVLPLCIKTNITVSCTADKLIDLFELNNGGIMMDSIKKLFEDVLPGNFYKFCDYHGRTKELLDPKPYSTNSIDLKQEYVNRIFSEHHDNPIVQSGNMLRQIAVGALTSTNSKNPVDIFTDKYCGNEGEAMRYINRVLSYGHTGILEQARHTYTGKISLSAYHQLIRHRLQNILRESIDYICSTGVESFYVPESIKNSIFYDEYTSLLNKISYEIRHHSTSMTLPFMSQFLPNATMIKVVISSNVKNDLWVMRERLCKTAQTEIREFMNRYFLNVVDEYKEIYSKGLPPCALTNVCKEGKMTCGKALEVRRQYEEYLK